MSVVKLAVGKGLDFRDFNKVASIDLDFILDYDIKNFKDDYISLRDDNKNYILLSGSGLDYKDKGGDFLKVTAGKITGFEMVVDGISIISETKMNLAGKTLSAAIDSNDTAKFINTLLSGSDQITGTKLADNFWGAAGNDKLIGGAGNDTLNGNVGNDKLYGQAGNDKLLGGAGKDHLDGGAGTDKLAGQAGIDTFVFKTGYGKDTITDFDAVGSDHDIADLSGLKSVKHFADLKANHMSVHDGGVLINAGHGDTLFLDDVRLKDLGAGDFHF